MTIKYSPDPRAKLILAASYSFVAVILSDLRLLAVSVLLGFTTAILMGSDIAFMCRRFRKLVAAIIGIAIVQSFFIAEGAPLVSLFGFTVVTDYGILQSAMFVLRMMAIAASGAILATDTGRRLIQGLIQLKCPYEIAFMVYVALRFFPILGEEIRDLLIAVQLRGLNLKEVRTGKKLKVYRYILTPVVAGSMLRAKELSASMEMRAFRAYPHRTSFVKLCMCKWDYVLIAFAAVILVGTLVIIV